MSTTVTDARGPAADDVRPADLECPRAKGEQLLAAARESGDRRAEVAALTDLAVLSANDGDTRRALDRLKEALQITRDLGDRAGEADVVANFGLLALTLENPALATQLFDRELAFARESGDRFAEKSALEHLGLARARLGDHARALDFFDRALALARAARDRQHEAVLLWLRGVQHAETGRRDRAVAEAREAIEAARGADPRQADVFAAHLQRYCDEDASGLPAEAAGRGEAVIGGSVLVSAAPADAAPPAARADAGRGAGLLRQGLSAARSVKRFLASGMKVTDPETLRLRLATCGACEHHTGLRCKVCGCFTNVKTRMAGEVCPAGKWPA